MILIPNAHRGPFLTPLFRILDVPGSQFCLDTVNGFVVMSVGPPRHIPGYALINNDRFLPHPVNSLLYTYICIPNLWYVLKILLNKP
jgi:hypothetical protein